MCQTSSRNLLELPAMSSALGMMPSFLVTPTYRNRGGAMPQRALPRVKGPAKRSDLSSGPEKTVPRSGVRCRAREEHVRQIEEGRRRHLELLRQIREEHPEDQDRQQQVERLPHRRVVRFVPRRE